MKIPKPRKRPEYKSLRMKALSVIEILTCNDDFTEDRLLSTIYKYSHVGLGHCLNKHEDWVLELNKIYKQLEMNNGSKHEELYKAHPEIVEEVKKLRGK